MPPLPATLKTYRTIESSKNSPTLFPIHKISVLHSDNTSFLVLSPVKIRIPATLFLTIIVGKRDFINFGTNYRVKRQDLLVAAESMIMDNDLDMYCRSPNQSADHQTAPKRPPNAFMLYSGTLRKKIKHTFPEYDNSDISKFLGIMWRSASSSIKQKFIEQAYEERQRHKLQYPNFEYNSRKESSDAILSFQYTPDNIKENDEWIKEIQQLMQQTEAFETAPYSTFAKMENEAIELINSVSADPGFISERAGIEEQWLPNHHWINCEPTEDLGTRSWRDMLNSVSLAYPEETEDYPLFDQV